ncbi:heparan-alpha-glucosaminide N-acetyltransferase domain-containing protein [Flavobacteriaceae bacterium F08102]|nr:heparan-alpha-glucosaminide N-acetyltransferase domain-containing protein [Flavobacteriaceae bacterium F08102]
MKQRVASVDVLRGLTVIAMILVNNPGSWSKVYPPLLHASWHGLTPTDFIFPMFLFIVGISISYAYRGKIADAKTLKKIGIRSLKLIGLGLFLAWFLPTYPFIKPYESLRFPGVLQRIGVVFFISVILFLYCNWKQLIAIGCSLLIAYWLFMGFVPLPDGTSPTFDRAANNWANYIDLKVLGTHMWKGDYDPEGLLSTLPAIVTCISGILIGKQLQFKSASTTTNLVIIGGTLLCLGYFWSLWFPLNKAIWSSSFVLVTSGYATLILALVYQIIDVKQVKIGNLSKYVGMNAISIFFLSGFMAKLFYRIKLSEKESIHQWIFNHLLANHITDTRFASLLYALLVASFYTGLAYILYKRKIVVKV